MPKSKAQPFYLLVSLVFIVSDRKGQLVSSRLRYWHYLLFKRLSWPSLFPSLSLFVPADFLQTNIFDASVCAKLMNSEDTAWPIPHFNCCRSAATHAVSICNTLDLDFKVNECRLTGDCKNVWTHVSDVCNYRCRQTICWLKNRCRTYFRCHTYKSL